MNKILVVDDESIVAMGLEERLTAMGYEIAGIASSGDEAIEKARALRPDLILMDITMPGKKDGIDAADVIKSEIDIPIIFLTAHADPKRIKRAKNTEPFGYIVKPYKDGELRAAIEVALHKKEKEVIYTQLQKEKERKIIAKLRGQSEKMKELETKYDDLREGFEKLKQNLQGSNSNDRLAYLEEHLDIIILGLLTNLLKGDSESIYNYIFRSMTEDEIVREIKHSFGIRIKPKTLLLSLEKLKAEGKIIEASGMMTISPFLLMEKIGRRRNE